MAHERYLRVISGLCDDSAQKKRYVHQHLAQSRLEPHLLIRTLTGLLILIVDPLRNLSLLNTYSPSPVFPPPSVRRIKTSSMPQPRA